MESFNDITLTDPNLNSLIGSPENLIPESVQTALIVSFVLLNVLTVVFVIAYIFSLVRKWKVQNAILQMHTDVVDIKTSLKVLTDTRSAPEPPTSTQRVQPGKQIASEQVSKPSDIS